MTKIKVVKASDGSAGFSLGHHEDPFEILVHAFCPCRPAYSRRQGLHDLACGTIVRSGEEVDFEEDLTQ